MGFEQPDDLRAVLRGVKSIAIIGLSDNPGRPSNYVCAFLQARGYDCVGVNPGLAGRVIQGVPVFASLAAIGRPVDMVDVFRKSEALAGLVDEVLALQPRPSVLWTQLGVVDELAAARAAQAGMTVVMNRCPKIELSS